MRLAAVRLVARFDASSTKTLLRVAEAAEDTYLRIAAINRLKPTADDEGRILELIRGRLRRRSAGPMLEAALLQLATRLPLSAREALALVAQDATDASVRKRARALLEAHK